MGIVVYTAIFGGFDELKPVLVGKEIRHVCFTDVLQCVAGWQEVQVECKEPRLAARKYKVLAHRWFPKAKHTIWVDGHIRLRVHPREMLKSLKGCDIALHAHRRRNCIYDEAEFCVACRKAGVEEVGKQMVRYRAVGYPEHAGLVETGLVVRRHTLPVREFNEMWWNEISHGSVRDQLSFNYVCWRLGMRYAIIPGKVYRNRALLFHRHAKKC